MTRDLSKTLLSRDSHTYPFTMARTNQILAERPMPDPCEEAYSLSVVVFNETAQYPHPFPLLHYEPWGDTPRTIVELRMCALSATIRDKPQWHEKMKDPAIKQKWREEALEQGSTGLDEKPEWRLTERMVDYVLAELEGYAKLRDEETGIQVGCYERVWKSDSLVSTSLRDALLHSVAKLEDVPPEQRDWHPGSNGRVLDLVHPSLYPLRYKSTHVHTPSEAVSSVATTPLRTEMRSDHTFFSERFQWLPSDFVIEPNGKATLKGSYINNIHPTHHKDLYPVIEQLVSRAVPMWERVLSDLRRPLSKLRMLIEDIPGEYGDYRGHVGCIFRSEEGCSTGPPSPYHKNYPDIDSWTDEQFDEFEANFPKTLPDALPSYTGALDVIQKTVDLAGSTLQVIVKLANIVLSPESPEYPGGTWHVEGMLNERIVSTFIYYYDEENITDSRLDFRTAVLEPQYHGQDDNTCSAVLYNMTRDSPLVQGLGGVKTCQGRCIAFPNIYQHQVQPFGLIDKTKPGHRKIVALFLVDPNIRIPSTFDVALQQREWIEEVLLSPDCLGQRLPLELINAIVDMTAEATMTRLEAEAVREEVMKERSVMVQSHTSKTYGIEFNMCEH